jgi:hypothetical protein
MRLIFGADKFNREAFSRLADRLYQEVDMQLMVNAKVDVLEGRTAEYHFHSGVIGFLNGYSPIKNHFDAHFTLDKK